jgi:hypothetical protein
MENESVRMLYRRVSVLRSCSGTFRAPSFSHVWTERRTMKWLGMIPLYLLALVLACSGCAYLRPKAASGDPPPANALDPLEGTYHGWIPPN